MRLLEKYPRVVVDVIEEDWTANLDGTKKFPDSSKANVKFREQKKCKKNVSFFCEPNGTEFDNLYLDMNGIIHPCTHPESGYPFSVEKKKSSFGF